MPESECLRMEGDDPGQDDNSGPEDVDRGPSPYGVGLESDPSSGEEHNDDDDGEESGGDNGEEAGHPSGYELLPQDVPPCSDAPEEDSAAQFDVGEVAGRRVQQDPENPNIRQTIVQSQRAQRQDEIAERVSVWSDKHQDVNRDSSIALDGDRVEEIKSVMAKISLPNSAIPSWAKGMNDKTWSDIVKEKLSNLP